MHKQTYGEYEKCYLIVDIDLIKGNVGYSLISFNSENFIFPDVSSILWKF